MDIKSFDYVLPKELIANSPANPRDSSRLLVIDRKTKELTHKHFYDIENYLGKNDVLVLNKTKVFPARFFGKKETGGMIEVLLIEEIKTGVWKALTKPGLKDGQTISFQGLSLQAVGHEEQTVLLETKTDKIELLNLLDKFGKTPLPPYIHSGDSEEELRVKYQTVYAKIKGSVAAPTAGFHFTEALLKKLEDKGVQIEYITLHVGLGTFAPVKTTRLEDHPMHYEYFEVEKDVAKRLNSAKKVGKKVISVGTTTTRVLETLANENRELRIGNLKGSTNLFIYPPYKFQFIDGLITNFHLPESTLLTLISAFVSYPNTDDKFEDFDNSLVGKAYSEAIKNKYRFYSFGDACLIL
jgi:S-adenosylmethionine:tRNA ribosyltransferase-isomerase